MLAVAMSGRGFNESVNAGTLTGFSFLWLAILVLIYKYTLVEGLARYTLAKGEHIFDGMHGFPGPENWEVFFMVLIYVLEMIGYGGLALLAGLLLQELIPFTISREILATITLIIIIPLLIRKNFSLFEKIVLFCAVVMIGGTLYTFFGITIPYQAIGAGLIPSATRDQVTQIIPIMGTVGSGLNLLLFSIWMREKIGLRHGATFYAEQIKNVRITQGIAFLITGLMTLAFFSIGYFTQGGQDIFTGAIQGLNTLPYGAAIFFFTGYVILFGVLLTGADGRARAIASILCSTSVTRLSEKSVYQILIIGFSSLMLIIVWSGNPKTLLSYTSACGAFMFAFTGVMLLYLDSHLPRYARGSRLWFIIMTIGALAYLLMALFREAVFFDLGLPLVQNLLGLLMLFYLVIRSGVITRTQGRNQKPVDTIICILVFSILGILGARSSIEIETLPISFATLIPLVSAMLGGPVVGILVGVIAGLGTVGSPGFQSLPWYVAVIPPVFAGCIAAFLPYLHKGTISRGNILILGMITGIVQIALLWSCRPTELAGDIVDILHQISIPTIGTLLIGLIVILYIIDEEKKTRRPQASSGSHTSTWQIPAGGFSRYFQGNLKEIQKTIVIVIIGLTFIRLMFLAPMSETGLPILNRIAVLGAILFLLTRSRTFQDILISATTMTERVWIIVVFGLFSAYGQFAVVTAGDLMIQFPDLGPAIAGILGGPILGAAAGIAGGLYALITDGPGGMTSALVTTLSGTLAGLCAMYWRRNLTYFRVIGIGVLVGALRYAIPLLFEDQAGADSLIILALNILIPVLGLILFQFIIREETVSFLSISKTGNTALDRNYERKMAILSQDTMARLNSLFTIISGRLLSLEFIMSQIGEEEIARKVRVMIRTDLIDDLLEDFGQFSTLHREGNRDDLQLALKAGQITRKLDRMIHNEGLDRLIHASLIRRADRLYHDYLSLLEGVEPSCGSDLIDLAPFITDIVTDITRQPATDEEFMDACDDPERYLQLLITRLAHISLFDRVTITYHQDGEIPQASVSRERFEDVIISLLESLATAGAQTISITGTDTKNAVLLTLDCSGSGSAWPPSFGEMADYAEECRINRGVISHENVADHLIITIGLTPGSG